MNWLGLVAVFVGGGIGSVLRYGISTLLSSLEVNMSGLATLTSNVLATALLGYVVIRMAPSSQSPLYLFLAVGLCGGFSTFSTFSLETMHFMRSGQYAWAIANVLVSVLVCVLVLFFLSKTNS